MSLRHRLPVTRPRRPPLLRVTGPPPTRRALPSRPFAAMAERDDSPISTSSVLSNIMVRTDDKQADARAMSTASPSSSTPPTSLDDGASVLSDMTKVEHTVEHTVELHEELAVPAVPVVPAPSDETPDPVLATPVAPTSESRRPARSSRKSVATYNVQILAGTAIHTPTKYLEKHHKNVVHGSLEEIALKEKIASAKKKTPRTPKAQPADDDPVEEQLAAEAAQAVRRRTSARVTDLRRDVLRNQSGTGDGTPTATSSKSASSKSTLRRSASDSRLKSAQSSSSSSSSALSLKRPRAGTDDEGSAQDAPPQEGKVILKPKGKIWLKQGLFVGQHRDFEPRLSESRNRMKKKMKKAKVDCPLPLPMFGCDRLLGEDPRHVFRDFKLKFDIYSPLPKKVKVDGWVKLNKSGWLFLRHCPGC